MGLLDRMVVQPPRPACPVCGKSMGRPGETPGQIVRPHDRNDQAMRLSWMDPETGLCNPCPGAGQPSVDPY